MSRFPSMYWHLGWTLTRAENTVYWFLYGKQALNGPPQHLNCRCEMVRIEP